MRTFALVILVQQRSVVLSRLSIGRREAGFLHKVLGEGTHTIVAVVRLGVKPQLGAFLQQLLQHLLGQGLALSQLILLHLELG